MEIAKTTTLNRFRKKPMTLTCLTSAKSVLMQSLMVDFFVRHGTLSVLDTS